MEDILDDTLVSTKRGFQNILVKCKDRSKSNNTWKLKKKYIDRIKTLYSDTTALFPQW